MVAGNPVAGDDVLAELIETCRRDHRAWINGDASGYALPGDGTILGAVGGVAFGGPDTAERQQRVAEQWRRGTGDIEYLNGGVAGNIAWLAFIERGVVEFVGDRQGVEHRWDLRVTEVFRSGDDGWERIHRHADVLVDFHGLAGVLPFLDRP